MIHPLNGRQVLVLPVIFLAQIAHAEPINLAAGDAEEALKEFGRQAHLSFIFDAGALDGIRTPSIVDETNPESALMRKLRGSRLTYEFTTPRLLSIHERPYRSMVITVCVENGKVCAKARSSQ